MNQLDQIAENLNSTKGEHSPIKDRFATSWMPEPYSGCWLWTKGLNAKGYGIICKGHKKKFTAHRISWLIFRGEIPAGLFVLHRCDIRSCVNPDHLFLGTAKDNSQDMVKKGRWRIKNQARGSRQGLSKLTESSVIQIRERHKAGEIRFRLAREFGVSWGSIDYVVRNLTWKHV